MSQFKKEFLSLQEACHYLGLSESTVRRHIKSGRLLAAQPGGPGTRLLIPRSTLTNMSLSRVATSTVPAGPTSQNPQRARGPKPRWQR